MANTRRILSLLMVLILSVGVFSACSGEKKTKWTDGDGKIDGDLIFWTQDTMTWQDYFNPAIEKFKTAYPDVKITVEYFSEFADKASSAFAAGTEPDVMQTWQSIGDWAKAGKLAALPDTVFTADEMEQYFYEGARKNKMYNGQYYCVPCEINVESPSLYVNMDILNDEGFALPAGWIEKDGPETWNELIDFAKKLTIKDGDNVVRSGLAYIYGQWESMFLSLIWQLGGDYRDEANKVVHFKTPEAKQAIEFMLRYCKGEDAVCSIGDARYDAFVQGTAAMCVGAPWYAGSIEIDAPDMNYQVFNMPPFIEGAKPICLATGGWGYLVSSKSTNKEAAWAFVKFMTSSEEVGDWAFKTGALPARMDSLSNLEYDPNVGSVAKAIAITKKILPYAQEDGAYMVTPSTLIYTIIRTQLRQVLEDGNIDAALENMEKQGNEMIVQNLGR